MIKNVNEIVAITKKAEKDKLVQLHDTTMMFINGKIAAEMEKAAKDCQTDIRFRATEMLDRNLIKQVLEAQGYEVAIKGYEVKISWLMAYVRG